MRGGSGVDKGEDNGSILNNAGRAGNILSISIVDVLQTQLSVLYARWVLIVFVGKTDVISVDIREVVADDDMSNEQVDFAIQAILASPLDVQLGSCACTIVENMIMPGTTVLCNEQLWQSYRIISWGLQGSSCTLGHSDSFVEKLHIHIPCGPGAPGVPGGPASPFWPGSPLAPLVPGRPGVPRQAV